MFPASFHNWSRSVHTQLTSLIQRKLRMAARDNKTVWSFMFLLTGVLGQSVNYPPPVCAVRGSTVTLPCTFTPLQSVINDGREVQIEIRSVRWCQNHDICQGTTPTVYDSTSTKNNPRYKYLGDLKRSCTLQITDIQKKDEATLRFRMEANDVKGHFTGPPGVDVTVDETPMKINSSRGDGRFRGGETVTLYCTARCTYHQLEVTWFRHGHALPVSGPALRLSNLTAEDSGNYICGSKANNITLSSPYSLHVEAGEEGDLKQPLIVGVAVGVLLVLFTLILVLCIIKRKREADQDQSAEGGEMEQKRHDDIYSDVLPPAERRREETSRAVEDVSYASVQFKHKNQARPAEEAEDAAIVYSSVVGRR